MKELVSFVMGDYFTDWCNYRQTNFEGKWIRNLSHYRLQDAGLLREPTKSDPLNMKEDKALESWRSNTFVGLTRTKTMAGVSLVTDNLLQSGNLPFGVSPTPKTQIALRNMKAEERDAYTQQMISISKTMEEQNLISRSDVELADCVSSAALYGDAYARFVVNEYTENHYNISGQLEEEETARPGLRAVSTWDIVRDWSTDRIQEGRGIIQRHKLPAPDLISFVSNQSDFIDKEIVREAMAGGAKTTYHSLMTDNPRFDTEDEGFYELLECFVTVPSHLVYPDEKEDPLAWSNVIVYILDGRGIGVNDSGDYRPFYHVPWQRDIDSPTNISIPDNVEDMQLVINNAFRGFEDNKHLSGNVWGAVKPEMLDEADLDGVFASAGKFINVADTTDDVGKAIQQIIIADVGESFLSLINVADVFADEHSMIPKIAHGGGGGGTEKTAYQTSQEIDKAGKYIASVIRNFDEFLIEPYSNDLYEFNVEMETEGFVGGLRFIAQGYSSYNDRVIRAGKITEFLNMAMTNEEFFNEFSPQRIAEAIGTSHGIDAVSMLKTAVEKEDERERNQAAMAEAKELERMQTAKIEAEILKIQAETRAKQGEGAMLESEGLHFKEKAETEEVHREIESEKLIAEIQKIEKETAILGRDSAPTEDQHSASVSFGRD